MDILSRQEVFGIAKKTVTVKNLLENSNETDVNNLKSRLSLTTTNTGSSDLVVSVQNITSGSAATILDATTWVIIDPATLLSAMTLTFPASPANGKVIQFSFGGTLNAASSIIISTLTFTPNTGQGIVGTSLFYSVEVEDHFRFIYNSSNFKWYQQ